MSRVRVINQPRMAMRGHGDRSIVAAGASGSDNPSN